MPKDHYVPQFYLRNFEDGGEFWVYDKKLSKGWRSNAYSTAKAEDFYTFTDDSGTANRDTERILCNAEGRHAKLLREIISKKAVDFSRQLNGLFEFIAIQHLRTPTMRVQANQAIQFAAKLSIEKMLSDPDIAEKWRNENPDGNWLALKQSVQDGHFEVSPGTDTIQALALVLSVSRSLRNKPFLSIVNAQDGLDFITSDNPVCAWWTKDGEIRHGGISRPDASVWIAISPKLGILLGSPVNSGTEDANRNLCLTMNKMVANQAERIVIVQSRAKAAWLTRDT